MPGEIFAIFGYIARSSRIMLKETLLKFFKLDGLVDNLTGYIESRIALMKYEVKEDIAKSLARVSMLLLFVLVFTFFMLFISVAVAMKIGESMGSFAGFSIVAAFYVLLLIIMMILREPIGKSLEKKFKSTIIQK
jgi:hypothetical protein